MGLTSSVTPGVPEPLRYIVQCSLSISHSYQTSNAIHECRTGWDEKEESANDQLPKEQRGPYIGPAQDTNETDQHRCRPTDKPPGYESNPPSHAAGPVQSSEETSHTPNQDHAPENGQ